MIRINLLAEGRRPTAVRKARKGGAGERNWTLVALLGAVAVGILATLVYWWSSTTRRDEAANGWSPPRPRSSA
jgi:hypothetical protein